LDELPVTFAPGIRLQSRRFPKWGGNSFVPKQEVISIAICFKWATNRPGGLPVDWPCHRKVINGRTTRDDEQERGCWGKILEWFEKWRKEAKDTVSVSAWEKFTKIFIRRWGE
jgi:hypothetical protein